MEDKKVLEDHEMEAVTGGRLSVGISKSTFICPKCHETVQAISIAIPPRCSKCQELMELVK